MTAVAWHGVTATPSTSWKAFRSDQQRVGRGWIQKVPWTIIEPRCQQSFRFADALPGLGFG